MRRRRSHRFEWSGTRPGRVTAGGREAGEQDVEGEVGRLGQRGVLPAGAGRLSPGPVRTEFFDVVGSQDAAVGLMATPGQVVTAARRALERDRTPPSIVVGIGNRLSATASTPAPRRLALTVAGRAVKA
ncbi:hypothetical protein ABZY34_09490 [Streptomyces virginiae]|uniref:hypothetical protein n=1 Tax=Streptomyces virginiae TaxID=1961 RepID=UPI0033A9AA5C